MTAIDDIKARLDIVDLVSETVKLPLRKELYGFLPVQFNSKTPAFAVFPDLAPALFRAMQRGRRHLSS
jgi:DNA primase